MARPAESTDALENLLPEESCEKAFRIVCPVFVRADDVLELAPKVLKLINDIFRAHYKR